VRICGLGFRFQPIWEQDGRVVLRGFSAKEEREEREEKESRAPRHDSGHAVAGAQQSFRGPEKEEEWERGRVGERERGREGERERGRGDMRQETGKREGEIEKGEGV
jgi:hypothetical protein